VRLCVVVTLGVGAEVPIIVFVPESNGEAVVVGVKVVGCVFVGVGGGVMVYVALAVSVRSEDSVRVRLEEKEAVPLVDVIANELIVMEVLRVMTFVFDLIIVGVASHVGLLTVMETVAERMLEWL
jgi:glutamate formiminotransferase